MSDAQRDAVEQQLEEAFLDIELLLAAGEATYEPSPDPAPAPAPTAGGR
jgi:hypothetical protein